MDKIFYVIENKELKINQCFFSYWADVVVGSCAIVAYLRELF